MANANFNKPNADLFKNRLVEHVNNPDTVAIAGQYTRGGVGNVVHYYNPNTKINVMKDMNGNFISGWKLSGDQIGFIKTTGKLGGSK